MIDVALGLCSPHPALMRQISMLLFSQLIYDPSCRPCVSLQTHLLIDACDPSTGGEKYKVRGILFKFARDVQVRNGNWLYGGPAGPMDELAGKASAHELRASVKFFEFGLLEQVSV